MRSTLEFALAAVHKSYKSLRRRPPTREPYERVLIVCEGAKTEPNYLNDLRNDLRLSTANIVIVGEECGSDPVSVVGFAIEEARRDKGYDRVYCVFDRDKHANFEQAIQMAKTTQIASQCQLIAVVSIPCFEFWLLLHFVYTTKAYPSLPGTSICQAVIQDLREHLKDYEKGQRGIYGATKHLLEVAVKNAVKLEQDNAKTGSSDPSTRLHNLVVFLRKLNGP